MGLSSSLQIISSLVWLAVGVIQEIFHFRLCVFRFCVFCYISHPASCPEVTLVSFFRFISCFVTPASTSSLGLLCGLFFPFFLAMFSCFFAYLVVFRCVPGLVSPALLRVWLTPCPWKSAQFLPAQLACQQPGLLCQGLAWGSARAGSKQAWSSGWTRPPPETCGSGLLGAGPPRSCWDCPAPPLSAVTL